MKTDKDGFSDLGTLVPSSSSGPPLPGGIETASTYQHYQVLRRADGSLWELGRGAMGITYKAFDVNLRCDVALKVVNAAMLHHPNARERFVREARAAARLRHRNVATVYHLGNDGEHFFYAMEFIDGETLEALVRRNGPMPVAAALRVVLQTARALGAAARQGLVHRDIKPANIMVTQEDGDKHLIVKVIDFGLARPTFSEGDSGSLTMHGFVGTPQYASPEQLEEKDLDVRSDIYSLGVTFWYLLTGQPPFIGSLVSICDQQRHSAPPWNRLTLSVHPSVRDLLARLLEKNPANRPQDATELRREVEACLAKVQGWELPVDDEAVWPAVLHGQEPAGAPAAVTDSSFHSALAIGSTLAGRYELVHLVGEGSGGRVFEARDRLSNSLVAVKQLQPEIVATPEARRRLEEEIRLALAAPHPNLVKILALETSPAPANAVCVIEERLNGFTLLDLLAVRGGGLMVAEGLRLLQQAALAIDHARNFRLDGLKLALHQLHLHFLAPAHQDRPCVDRSILQRPMVEWTDWALKIDPLGLAGRREDSTTWAGDITLVGHSLHAPPGNAGRSRAAASLQILAALTYELLGGTPLPPGIEIGRSARYVSLPNLNEESNAVLRRALSAKSDFESGHDFFETLARAAGFLPETLLLTPGIVTHEQPLEAAPTHLGFDGVAASAFPATVHEADTAVAGFSLIPGNGIMEPLRGERKGAASLFRQSLWARIAIVWALLLCLGAAVLWRQSRPQSVPPRHAALKKSPAASNPSPAFSRPPQAAPSPFVAHVAPAPVPAPPPESAPTPEPLLEIARNEETPLPVAEGDQSTAPSALLPIRPAPLAASVKNNLPPPASPEPKGKMVQVRITSQPQGAEILLRGESLHKTPLKISLPAGDHELVAHYRNWPEVRQQIHLAETQREAKAEIRLMPPNLVPLGRSTPAPASQRRPSRRFAGAMRQQNSPPASKPILPAMPLETSPLNPLAAGLPTQSLPMPDARPAIIRRARPVLEPFSYATPRKHRPVASSDDDNDE